MKLKIEIKNRFTGKVIFEFETENNTVSKTINEYVRKTKEEKGFYAIADLTGANLTRADLTDANLTRANLTRADLTGADLTDADLTGADLTRADLTGADLTGADLTDADLTDADLTGADLTGADLTRADLTDADLTRADLTGADLTRADLTRANLTRADLTRANLTRADLTRADLTGADLTDADLLRFKSDLWRVLLMFKGEIEGLKKALVDGKVNGSKYSGECACLKGTIANVRGCHIEKLPIEQNVSEPSEQWFLQISEGQNPTNSGVVRKTLEWIEEFEMLIKA